MKNIYPNIDRVMIFSDNCAAQFKSKYTISTLCRMQEEYGIAFEWNFFSSSHGKGAVDGIGATVKRHMWMTVKGKRDVHITSPKNSMKKSTKKYLELPAFTLIKKQFLNKSRN